mmetsp:Transcript_6437/g.10671  ORF Transcript_6437/g.10671 Transcript_6437/m.10671 type:complete len:227 (-) Transcript_6437:22-702(-)
MGLFRSIHDTVAERSAEEEVNERSGKQGGKHVRSETILDRIKALVQREESPTAPSNGSTKDRPEYGESKITCWDGRSSRHRKLHNDIRPLCLVKENNQSRKERRKSHHFAKDREVVVQNEGSKNSNRIGIRRKRYRDRVDEDRNHDSTSSTSENQRNELVRQRGGRWDLTEDLRSVKERVSEHAHVLDFVRVHDQELRETVVEQPSRRIGWRFFGLITATHGGKGN